MLSMKGSFLSKEIRPSFPISTLLLKGVVTFLPECRQTSALFYTPIYYTLVSRRRWEFYRTWTYLRTFVRCLGTTITTCPLELLTQFKRWTYRVTLEYYFNLIKCLLHVNVYKNVCINSNITKNMGRMQEISRQKEIYIGAEDT